MRTYRKSPPTDAKIAELAAEASSRRPMRSSSVCTCRIATKSMRWVKRPKLEKMPKQTKATLQSQRTEMREYDHWSGCLE